MHIRGTRSNPCQGSQDVEKKIAEWFAAKRQLRVPHISDIRRNIVIPLYAGRRTRGKRKR